MKDPTIFFTARRARCICGVEEKEELRDQNVSKCLTAQEELVYQSQSWRPLERQHEEASLFQPTALRGSLRVAAALVRSLDSISPVKEQSCWLKSFAEPRNSIRQLWCSQCTHVLYIHRWHFKLPTLQSDDLIRLENCQCGEGLSPHLIKLKVKHSLGGWFRSGTEHSSIFLDNVDGKSWNWWLYQVILSFFKNKRMRRHIRNKWMRLVQDTSGRCTLWYVFPL